MIIPPRTAIAIIILFHLVGLIGLSLPVSRPLFLYIVPWHIMLMLLVIILSHHYLKSRFGVFLLVIFWAGFLLEWIGVHTGWLFGNYSYGSTLGLKLSAIPLTIGVNWFLLIYSTGVTLQRSRLKNIFIRIMFGALLLVAFDVLIEPVAIRFNYWRWQGNIIPLKNYISWFIVSAGMLYIFEWFNFKKQSLVAVILLAIQFLFFGILNFIH